MISDETTREILRLTLKNNSLLNQAFDKVFIAATSFAIVFWSVRLIKAERFAKIIAVFGCVIGLLSLVGILSGQLRMNLHGFGLAVFGQTFWTILVAIYLLRPGDFLTKDQLISNG
jgi:hypothetical protein